jgi:hypothetical protein
MKSENEEEINKFLKRNKIPIVSLLLGFTFATTIYSIKRNTRKFPRININYTDSSNVVVDSAWLDATKAFTIATTLVGLTFVGMGRIAFHYTGSTSIEDFHHKMILLTKGSSATMIDEEEESFLQVVEMEVEKIENEEIKNFMSDFVSKLLGSSDTKPFK